MKQLNIIYCALVAIVALSCSCKRNPPVEFLGDVKKLVKKSPQQIAAILGKGTGKEKVTGFPCDRADCERRYYRNGQFEVIFKKKKSDRITIHQVPNYTDNDRALESLGLSGVKPTFQNPKIVLRYNDVKGIGEISFFSDSIVIQVSEPK